VPPALIKKLGQGVRYFLKMMPVIPFDQTEQLGKVVLNIPEDPIQSTNTPKKPVRKRVIIIGFLTSVCLMIIMNFTEVVYAALNWDMLQCIKNSSYNK
jgi:hypothetical protein